MKVYLHQQVQLWLGDYSPADLTPTDEPFGEAYCIELGEKLATLPLVQILLKTVGEKTYSYPELLRDVIQKRLALPSNDPLYQQQLLDSLLSPIATDRRRIELADGTAIVVPWVTLRVQFWLRELRRMVGSIDPQPELLCPFCHSSSGLSILGTQAASLTSAMIGVLYTTPFNTDKKLLTFSDSGQDAAHRAGFYAARTYRTTLRTAIAHTVRN